MYAGFELYEWEPVKPGSEEYKNSEKYALRPRDFAGALNEGRSLEPYLTRLNEIRRAHPALQQLRDIHFHHTDNDQVIAYSKTDVKTGDTVLVVCTLDPDNAQTANLALDMPALGPTGTTPSSCTTRSAGRPSTGASSRSRGWSRGAPSRTS